MSKIISELIEKTSANDSDVLLIEDSTSTNRITKANLLKEVNNKADNLSQRVEAVENLKEGSELEVTTESGYVVCENTNNGQIEELKIEGNTLVNLATTKSGTINNSSGTSNYLYLNLQRHIDIGTYTLIATVANNTLDMGIKLSYSTVSNGVQYPGYLFEKDFTGLIVKKLSIPYLTSNIRLYTDNTTTGSVVIDNLILLEGDHTQNPPSYFKGLKSVGDGVDKIEVLSSNKLIDIEDGTIASSNGQNAARDTRLRSKDYLIYNDKTDIGGLDFSKYDITFFAYDKYEKFLYATGTWIASNATLEGNVYYYRFALRTKKDDVISTNNEKILLYKTNQSNKKQILYQTKAGNYEKPTLRSIGSVSDSIEKHSDGKYYYHKRCEQRVYQSNDETKSDVITDKTNTVYKLATEEVYECVNLDLDSYEGETSVIFDGGAISPKITFKIASHIANTVQVLKDRIKYLEDKVMDMFKAVLCGDMQTLAYELYPEDFKSETDETAEETELL